MAYASPTIFVRAPGTPFRMYMSTSHLCHSVVLLNWFHTVVPRKSCTDYWGVFTHTHPHPRPDARSDYTRCRQAMVNCSWWGHLLGKSAGKRTEVCHEWLSIIIVSKWSCHGLSTIVFGGEIAGCGTIYSSGGGPNNAAGPV